MSNNATLAGEATVGDGAILGGFSAQVEKGMTATDLEYIASIPEALPCTEKVCASINIATSHKGINKNVKNHL